MFHSKASVFKAGFCVSFNRKLFSFSFFPHQAITPLLLAITLKSSVFSSLLTVLFFSPFLGVPGLPSVLSHALGGPQLQECQLSTAPPAPAQVFLRHVCGGFCIPQHLILVDRVCCFQTPKAAGESPLIITAEQIALVGGGVPATLEWFPLSVLYVLLL